MKPAAIPNASSNRDKLKAVLDMEAQAIKNYSQRAQQAEELGETALKVRLEEMVNDETEHYETIQMLLRDWSDSV
jgi:rubrerythrin